MVYSKNIEKKNSKRGYTDTPNNRTDLDAPPRMSTHKQTQDAC